MSDARDVGRLDLPLGPKLASGRDADVYDLGDGRVLRRYRSDSKMPSGALKTSEQEARTMRFLRERGYPVPAVHDVCGIDMVMDRVDGPTMLKDLGSHPWMVWRHARTLAALHRRLHTIEAPDWLPTFASHPAFAAASDEERALLAGDAFVHLDLHPDNVILSRRGPVVIDWRNARRGAGAIDVAATWLIMATSDINEVAMRRWLISAIRRLFVAGFLRHIDRAAAARRIPSMGGYRLADRNLRDTEKPAIHSLVRQVSQQAGAGNSL
jgi:aminoglycoside phosphotransferase (APT) family kinase protein